MGFSDDVRELAQWLKALLDRLGAAASSAERGRMAERFLMSSRFEHAFWEMAWTM
ncbi:MAG: hypothetical protein HY726_14315 [Candidatus Rokubacteria bacterium]|nr:hypothetical protein [Candidatus Rokubacteria bacterium]